MFSLYPAWFRHYDPPYVWSHPRKTAPGIKRILLHPRPLPFGTLPFPSESAGHFYGSLSTPIAIDAQIEACEDFPLKFDPGTQLGYNNAGYSMLVKVIEEVSDASFDNYL
jgi:CubicO group peptidase (beta-lactamase class C family)